jgi:hypothetical protein
MTEEAANTSGPVGTYGCACVSDNARNCLLFREGWKSNADSFDERCECLCHQWRTQDGDETE